jgi:hypothetical protein
MPKLLHPHSTTRRLGLLAAAVALFVVAMMTAPPSAHACQNWTDYYTYYSDASKTQQVGWCEYDCYCVSYCDGEKTPYYIHSSWPGCL